MASHQESVPTKAGRTRPASSLEIRLAGNIQLTPEIEAVLREMFGRFRQVAIEAEFGRGFSGSRAFRVRLIERGGRAHLPAVVKIAPAGLISQEWQAYQTWVEHGLPNIARLEAAPLLPSESQWGGLRYALVGGGTFTVQSLSDYYQTATVEDVCWVLENRLFEILGSNWWLDNRAHRAYQMQADYDILLPVNLQLKPAPSALPDRVRRIEAGATLPLGSITTGDEVRLNGFIVTKVDAVRRELSLNLPSSSEEDRLPPSCRLRIEDMASVTGYRTGDSLHGFDAVVTATRHELLSRMAGQALGDSIDLSAERLALPDGATLPNPLLAYPTLLNNFLTVKISTVHGDLNLENILVDPATREVSLIDFATVRQGHALHDLLRLETEVVVMLLPLAFQASGLSPTAIYPFYRRLYQATFTGPGALPRPTSNLEKPLKMLLAIRRMAAKCLFNMDDWREYYQALVLYLLGALKFQSLDLLAAAPLPRQLAFWGAAAALHLLQTVRLSPGPVRPEPPEPLPDRVEPPGLETPYGTMHPESRFYIERPADKTCWQYLSRPYAVTLFAQAPMQMGKSSLLRRMLHRTSQAHGWLSAFIDFQKFPEQSLVREEEFLVALCIMIGDALGIPEAIDAYWTGRRTNLIKCSLYLSQYLIPRLQQPFVLAMDEVERMLDCPFRADFFGMLRTWHNDRVYDESFARMSLFLSSSTDPYLLIDNPHQSPFNVATLIQFQDFTLDEVLELNRRHHTPLTPIQVGQLMDLLAGHPFLTRVALYQLATGQIDLPALLARATDEHGPFGAHLQHYRRRVLHNPELVQALRQVLRAQAPDENGSYHRLHGAGLVIKDGQRVAWRNRLYERYFKEHLNG